MNVNARSDTQMTPLDWAIQFARADVARFLVEHGARPENSPSHQLLATAVRKGVEMIELLESFGLDLIRDGKGQCLLLQAVWGGDLPVCRYLIERGVEVNECNAKWGSPLHFARMMASLPEYAEIETTLIEAGAQDLKP